MAQSMIARLTGIQALIVLLIALGFTTLGAWIATVGSAPIIWSLRIGSPIAAIAVAVWLFKIIRKPELLPDMLRQISRKYFEKRGLCFMPVFEIGHAGQCLLCIYFQNRNSGQARTVVAIRPLHAMFARRKPPAVSMTIDCPGGAFGVCRIPVPIPAQSQGKRMAFAIGADTKYPSGRGRLLRLRTGLRVSSIREIGIGHQLAHTVLLLPLGLLSVTKPAHATMVIPKGVRQTADEPIAPKLEILWVPDMPTGGFPVTPRRAA